MGMKMSHVFSPASIRVRRVVTKTGLIWRFTGNEKYGLGTLPPAHLAPCLPREPKPEAFLGGEDGSVLWLRLLVDGGCMGGHDRHWRSSGSSLMAREEMNDRIS